MEHFATCSPALEQPMSEHRKRILAVASAGGHWVQLLRLRPAFAGHEVRFLSTSAALASQVRPHPLYVVNDASMWDKVGLAKMAVRIAKVMLTYRPHVIITTGAAPGFFGILVGRLLGAKTIWIDSIANAEELSLAGRKAKRWADHWLTQWPELAREEGPHYIGSVI